VKWWGTGANTSGFKLNSVLDVSNPFDSESSGERPKDKASNFASILPAAVDDGAGNGNGSPALANDASTPIETDSFLPDAMQRGTVVCVGKSVSGRQETHSDAIPEKSGEHPVKTCDDTCSLDQPKPPAQDSSAVGPGGDGEDRAPRDAPAISHDQWVDNYRRERAATGGIAGWNSGSANTDH
jgi:hypothetical protein